MDMDRQVRQWLRQPERGDGAVLQTAIIGAALLVLLVLFAAAGRMSGAHTPIDNAANNAARAASISRTPGEAHAAAVQAATSTLSGQGSSCPDPSITVDTSGLSAPVGQVGVVRVSISCTVDLSDLHGLPLPGSRTVTADASSVVDAYRARGVTP